MELLVPNAEAKLAKKRVILRRYLRILGKYVPADSNLRELQAKVKAVHQERLRFGRPTRAWPMTKNKIAELIDQRGSYVRQLFTLKRVFRPESTIGIVVDGCHAKQCATVADLVTVGCASPKDVYLDFFIREYFVPADEMPKFEEEKPKPTSVEFSIEEALGWPLFDTTLRNKLIDKAQAVIGKYDGVYLLTCENDKFVITWSAE